MEHPEFVQLILSWYKKNKRDLPWRQEKDPYKIWLSEVLLQQTRVNQGLPYYYKFINEFPNITSLADAEEEKILRLWQGLGYYSRARNMHKAARDICLNNHSQFPETYSQILKLKGVGEYTAAAVASFAFNEKVAVVDGNVFRVLSRVYGLAEEINSTKGKKAFKKLAESLLPDQHCDDYNQGIMEFGALHCTPSNPNCDSCPLTHFCYARINKAQNLLPVKAKAPAKRNRHFNYIVYEYKDKVLMHKRSGKDIWQGLYQFPLQEEAEPSQNELKQIIGEPRENYGAPKIFKHILSHQIIKAQFWKVKVASEKELSTLAQSNKSEIYSIEQVENLPKPILINNYLKEFIF